MDVMVRRKTRRMGTRPNHGRQNNISGRVFIGWDRDVMIMDDEISFCYFLYSFPIFLASMMNGRLRGSRQTGGDSRGQRQLIPLSRGKKDEEEVAL